MRTLWRDLFKTGEPIDMLFGLAQEIIYYMGAHWRRLVNTTEPSVYGGDAAYYVILR